MFSRLKFIIEKVKSLSSSIDEFRKDTVIQSLPTYTYVNRAKVLIDQNKFTEARKILLEALELPQKDALVYKYLGTVCEKLREFESAVEYYQTSADINPQDRLIWQRLGFMLVTVGKHEQAEKSFENSNRVSMGNSDTFTGWGMALMKQQKYNDAHEKFLEAVKLNKYNFPAMFLAAVMEIKLEIYDRAEAKLTFLTSVAPNVNNLYEFAKLKYLKKDYDSSIHYAAKSVELNQEFIPGYVILGELYSLKNDYENSVKNFSIAEEKDSTDSGMYFEWAKALIRFNQYCDAKQKFLKTLELNSEKHEVYAQLALCCALLKQIDEAKDYLNKAQDNEKEIKNLANAIIDYENGETEKAMSYLRSVDDDSICLYYLAKCYQRQNNDTKVKDCFEAALNIKPSYSSALLDYAKYLISKEDYEDAKRKLRKAIKLDENNIEVLNMLFFVNYVLAKQDLCEYNIKETISIAEKIESINPDLFEYPEQKAELLFNQKESDKN